MNYKVHPIAEIFPRLPVEGQDFKDLVTSIEATGLLEPIVMDGDMLLDGRNRLAACAQAKVEPRFVQFRDITDGGQDVSMWIMGKNIHRRHLTQDQKAVAWTEYYRVESELLAKANKDASKFKKGQSGNPSGKTKEQVRTESCEPAKRDFKKEHANSTAGQIAEKVNVSHQKVSQAIKLAKAADTNPEAKAALEKVKSGALPLAKAVKQNDFSPQAKAAGDAAERDSAKLWRLKSLWKKTSKRDRGAFLSLDKQKRGGAMSISQTQRRRKRLSDEQERARQDGLRHLEELFATIDRESREARRRAEKESR